MGTTLKLCDAMNARLPYGSPHHYLLQDSYWKSPNKEGTEACHGAALGADEVALTRDSSDGLIRLLKYLMLFIAIGMRLILVPVLSRVAFAL